MGSQRQDTVSVHGAHSLGFMSFRGDVKPEIEAKTAQPRNRERAGCSDKFVQMNENHSGQSVGPDEFLSIDLT